MPSNVNETIYSRLYGNSTIRNAVKGNIFTEYRDDLIPALVYEIRTPETHDSYEGLGAIYLELSVSCVASLMKKATEIADLVVAFLTDSTWSDSNNEVLRTIYETKDETYMETETKNKRIAIVDCKFTLIMKEV